MGFWVFFLGFLGEGGGVFFEEEHVSSTYYNTIKYLTVKWRGPWPVFRTTYMRLTKRWRLTYIVITNSLKCCLRLFAVQVS